MRKSAPYRSDEYRRAPSGTQALFGTEGLPGRSAMGEQITDARAAKPRVPGSDPGNRENAQSRRSQTRYEISAGHSWCVPRGPLDIAKLRASIPDTIPEPSANQRRCDRRQALEWSWRSY